MCIVVYTNFRIIRYEIAESIATGNEVTGSGLAVRYELNISG